MRFVVLIDITQASVQLLRFAHNVATNAQAILLIMHQSKLPIPAMGDSESHSSIKNESKTRSLDALRNYVGAIVNEECPIEYEVTTGNLQARLHSLEKSVGFEIVFVGIKNKGVVDKILIGNTAAKLASVTSRIIFAIPEGREAANIDT